MTPTWPDDILFLPVESDGKGPDTAELPGTWGYDGTGCHAHGDLADRRYGIVDVDVGGWRLLIVDLDTHKMDPGRAQRVKAAIWDGPETRIHESQSGGLHVFYWVRGEHLTDDGKLPVILAEEIDDKLNGYVLSPHCDGYEITHDRQPAEIEPGNLPGKWVERERVSAADEAGLEPTDAKRDDVDDLDVHDVISRAKHPEGKRVAHPIHGSSTGTNFMVDPRAESWRCWRHDATGNALHLVGMDAGIISCGDWPLSSDTWGEILAEAEDRGLIEPRKRPGDVDERAVVDAAKVLDKRLTISSVDEITDG